MYLAISTISTCLPKPLLHLNNPSQCYLLDFGGILYDDDGEELDRLATLVRPGHGVKLTTGAYKKNGISLDIANRIGMDPSEVLHWFDAAARKADRIVGHNVRLDSQVMALTGARLGRHIWLPPCDIYCTMMREANHLPLSGNPVGESSPTLDEAFASLFGKDRTGSRSAIDNAAASMRIYQQTELQRSC